MKSKMSQTMAVVAFGVCLYTALNHLNIVAAFLQSVTALVFPVLLGALLAFILSVPHRYFEKRLRKLSSHMRLKPSAKTIAWTALILTFATIVLIVVLVCMMVIPALADSVNSARILILERLLEWVAALRSLDFDTTLLTQIGEILYDALSLDFSSYVGKFLQSVADIAFSTVRGIVTGGMGLVIAAYILLSKHDLSRQCKKLLYAFLPDPAADHICGLGSLIHQTYSKFLTGQCAEAVILGVLIFTAMTIAQIPYAGIIAALTGILSFVPYIGAFLACFLGTLLVLFVSPVKALICLILYQVVQFIENQFIYPHVVGNSVGLPPLWTMIAVFIGGKLLGIVGMLFFIPAASVIYSLLRDIANQRLKRKRTASGQADGVSGD